MKFPSAIVATGALAALTTAAPTSSGIPPHQISDIVNYLDNIGVVEWVVFEDGREANLTETQILHGYNALLHGRSEDDTSPGGSFDPHSAHNINGYAAEVYCSGAGGGAAEVLSRVIDKRINHACTNLVNRLPGVAQFKDSYRLLQLATEWGKEHDHKPEHKDWITYFAYYTSADSAVLTDRLCEVAMATATNKICHHFEGKNSFTWGSGIGLSGIGLGLVPFHSKQHWPSSHPEERASMVASS